MDALSYFTVTIIKLLPAIAKQAEVENLTDAGQRNAL